MNRVLPFLAMAALSACSTAHGSPVYGTPPAKAPAGISTSVGVSRVCRAPTDGLPQTSGSRRPWVDPGPTGGVLLWLPGLNSTHCRGILKRLDAARAEAFAVVVDTAKPFPDGMFHCPNDDGSVVTVFLDYRGKARAEVVRMKLGGCGGISAPGRATVEGGGLGVIGPPPRGL